VSLDADGEYISLWPRGGGLEGDDNAAIVRVISLGGELVGRRLRVVAAIGIYVGWLGSL
jgi:hypothetical protein